MLVWRTLAYEFLEHNCSPRQIDISRFQRTIYGLTDINKSIDLSTFQDQLPNCNANSIKNWIDEIENGVVVLVGGEFWISSIKYTEFFWFKENYRGNSLIKRIDFWIISSKWIANNKFNMVQTNLNRSNIQKLQLFSL